MKVEAQPLSRFELVWLAEALRVHDGPAGPVTDAAVIEARSSPGTLAQRLVLWTRRRTAQPDWQGRHALIRSRFKWVFLILAVFALVTGFTGAVAVLGDGARPVNVVWALGGLLGIHCVALLLWLLGFMFRPSNRLWDATLLGRVWQFIARRLARNAPSNHAAEPDAALTRVLAQLLAREGGVRWWMGVVTHALWSCALMGALLGLLAAMAVRRYDFVWETTVLSSDFFQGLVAVLGEWPAMLGWRVPDSELVRASGNAAVLTEVARTSWASWLLACVLLYGVVPRLMLLGGCVWRLNVWRQHMHVDLQQPYFVALASLLEPPSTRVGVTDAAPLHWPPAGRGQLPRHDTRPVQAGTVMVVGIELRAELWSQLAVPAQVWKWGNVDDRVQRQAVRAALAEHGPQGVLLCCDARQSPDRGNLALISELAAMGGRAAVCLLGTNEIGSRTAVWLETLAGQGFAATAYADADAAQPVFCEPGLARLEAAADWLAAQAQGAGEGA